MNNILIIGSSGYIGSRLSQHLTQNGHQVEGVDLEKPKVECLQTLKMDYVNLKLDDITHYKHIILLAANSSVAAAKKDPKGTIENNILGLQNLISIMSDTQILYFASSASVYDGSKNNLANETDDLSASSNIYDLSKRTGEELILMSGIKSVIFRFGTVNGPSPNMRYDLVINAMVLSAIRNKKIQLSNPHVNRAILSIDDLCPAIENSIELKIGFKKNEILNLASFNTSIGAIAREISDHFQVPIVEEESGSTYDFSISVNKAQRDIMFQPRDSIKEIISKLHKNIMDIHHD